MNNEWKMMLVDLPDLNKPFVAVYSDGSGAVVSMRITDDEYIDAEGEVSHSTEGMQEAFCEWLYLPTFFRFWYQINGEEHND